MATTKEKKGNPSIELDRITATLAQQIKEKAVERATNRKEEMLKRIEHEIRVMLSDDLTDEQVTDVIRGLLEPGIGESLIRAEILRMSSNITFLADKGTPKPMPCPYN